MAAAFNQILEIGASPGGTSVVISSSCTIRADWANEFVYLFGFPQVGDVSGIVKYGMTTGTEMNEVVSTSLFTGGFAGEWLTDQNLVGSDGSLYLAGGISGGGTVGLPCKVYQINPTGWTVTANFGIAPAPATTAVKSCLVQAGGSAYTHATITFSSTYGAGATATATIVGGVITAITVNTGGAYTVAPTFTITGDGTGAIGIVNSMSAGIAYAPSDSTHFNHPADWAIVPLDDVSTPGPFIAAIQQWSPLQPQPYNSGTTYALGNVVFDTNGAFWVSVQNSNTGNPLVNGFNYGTGSLSGFWLMIPAWGQYGQPVGSTPGIYNYADCVSWGGQVWFAQQDGFTINPADPPQALLNQSSFSLYPPGYDSTKSNYRIGDIVAYSGGSTPVEFWMPAHLTVPGNVAPSGPNWLLLGTMGRCIPGTRVGVAATPATGTTDGKGAEVAILDCRSGAIGLLTGANSFGIDEPLGWVAADLNQVNGPGFFVVLGTDVYENQYGGNDAPAAIQESTMALGFYGGNVDTGGVSFLLKLGTVAPSAVIGPNGAAVSFHSVGGVLFDDASTNLIFQCICKDGTGAWFFATVGVAVFSATVAWTVISTDGAIDSFGDPKSIGTNPLNTYLCPAGNFVYMETSNTLNQSRMLQINMASGAFTETAIPGLEVFNSGAAYNDAVGASGTLLLGTGYDGTKPGAPRALGSTPSSFFWFASLTSSGGSHIQSYFDVWGQ